MIHSAASLLLIESAEQHQGKKVRAASTDNFILFNRHKSFLTFVIDSTEWSEPEDNMVQRPVIWICVVIVIGVIFHFDARIEGKLVVFCWRNIGKSEFASDENVSTFIRGAWTRNMGFRIWPRCPLSCPRILWTCLNNCISVFLTLGTEYSS